MTKLDPIFHLSGLTADGWMYGPGMRKLNQHGFGTHTMKMGWHGWDGIPSDSRRVRPQVERYIEQLQRRGHDVDRVQLSGDSEGGLIARHALTNDPQLRPLVSRLTTNGSPHQGIRALGHDGFSRILQRSALTPPGMRDLLISSPVMRDMNAAWDDALAGIAALDPNFRVHAVASRIPRHDHDGLVPTHSAWLHGDPARVTNYLVDGIHSLNLSYGRDQTDNFRTLLASFGSQHPEHVAAAERAHAVSQAWAAQRGLIPTAA